MAHVRQLREQQTDVDSSRIAESGSADGDTGSNGDKAAAAAWRRVAAAARQFVEQQQRGDQNNRRKSSGGSAATQFVEQQK